MQIKAPLYDPLNENHLSMKPSVNETICQNTGARHKCNAYRLSPRHATSRLSPRHATSRLSPRHATRIFRQSPKQLDNLIHHLLLDCF